MLGPTHNISLKDARAYFHPPVARTLPDYPETVSENELSDTIQLSRAINESTAQVGLEFEVYDQDKSYQYTFQRISQTETGMDACLTGTGRWKNTANTQEMYFVTVDQPNIARKLSTWNDEKFSSEDCVFFRCISCHRLSGMQKLAHGVRKAVTTAAVGTTLIGNAVPNITRAQGAPAYPQGIKYVIRPGDNTLAAIAARMAPENTAFLQHLVRLNGFTPDKPMHIGETVLLPSLQTEASPAQQTVPKTQISSIQAMSEAPAQRDKTETTEFINHTIKKGDTLSRISRKYDVPVKVLERLNTIRDPRQLRIGFVLKIPATQKTTVVQTSPATPLVTQRHSEQSVRPFNHGQITEGKNIDTAVFVNMLSNSLGNAPSGATPEFKNLQSSIALALGISHVADQNLSVDLGNISQSELTNTILVSLENFFRENDIKMILPKNRDGRVVFDLSDSQIANIQKFGSMKILGAKGGFKIDLDTNKLVKLMKYRTQQGGENFFIMNFEKKGTILPVVAAMSGNSYIVIDPTLTGSKIVSLESYIQHTKTHGMRLKNIVATGANFVNNHRIPDEERRMPDVIAKTGIVHNTPTNKSLAIEKGVVDKILEWTGWNNKAPESKAAVSQTDHPEKNASKNIHIDVITDGNYGFLEESAEVFIARMGGKIDKIPAGMQNNNPFNIKYSDSDFQKKICVGWKHEKSENKDQNDFQSIFMSPEYGMYSGIRLLLHRFENNGYTTVMELIASRQFSWTQDKTAVNKNGRNAAREIAQRMGVGVDDVLDFRDGDIFFSFIRELLTQEQGVSSKLYTDKMIRRCIDIANRDTNSPVWPGYFDGIPKRNSPKIASTAKKNVEETPKNPLIPINTDLSSFRRGLHLTYENIGDLVGASLINPLGNLRGDQEGVESDMERMHCIAEKIGIGEDLKNVGFGDWCGANTRAIYTSIVAHLESVGVRLPHIWSERIGSGIGAGNFFNTLRVDEQLPENARVVHGIKEKPDPKNLQKLLLSTGAEMFILSYSHSKNGHVNIAFRVDTAKGPELVIFDASWLKGETLTSKVRGIGGFHDFTNFIASFVNGTAPGAAPNRYDVASVLCISTKPLPKALPPEAPTVLASTILGSIKTPAAQTSPHNTIAAVPRRVASVLQENDSPKTTTHLNGKIIMEPYTITARREFIKTYFANHPEMRRKYHRIQLDRIGTEVENLSILAMLQKEDSILQEWRNQVMQPKNYTEKYRTQLSGELATNQ